MYRITFKRSAQKELAEIPKPYNQNIVTSIDKFSKMFAGRSANE